MSQPPPPSPVAAPAAALPTDADPAAPVAAPQPPAAAQRHNPLHGVTLERMVTELAEHYGWPGLAERIPVRCFALDPSVSSSLKFLRRTPWAREKTEGLYLFMQREARRAQSRPRSPGHRSE